LNELKKYTKSCVLSKQIEQEKQKTKNKMEKFLEAVAAAETNRSDYNDLDKFEIDSQSQIPTTSRSNRSHAKISSRYNALSRSKSFDGSFF
jgi:hypothetical protein